MMMMILRAVTPKCPWREYHFLLTSEIPASRKFCLASGGCKLRQTRPWLGLVDLSRITSGTFFFGRSILPHTKFFTSKVRKYAYANPAG